MSRKNVPALSIARQKSALASFERLFTSPRKNMSAIEICAKLAAREQVSYHTMLGILSAEFTEAFAQTAQQVTRGSDRQPTGKAKVLEVNKPEEAAETPAAPSVVVPSTTVVIHEPSKGVAVATTHVLSSPARRQEDGRQRKESPTTKPASRPTPTLREFTQGLYVYVRDTVDKINLSSFPRNASEVQDRLETIMESARKSRDLKQSFGAESNSYTVFSSLVVALNVSNLAKEPDLKIAKLFLSAIDAVQDVTVLSKQQWGVVTERLAEIVVGKGGIKSDHRESTPFYAQARRILNACSEKETKAMVVRDLAPRSTVVGVGPYAFPQQASIAKCVATPRTSRRPRLRSAAITARNLNQK